MAREETRVYTARLPVALLADLEECAAEQHRSVNSLLWTAAETLIRKWRAAQSREQAEFVAGLTDEDKLEVVLKAAAKVAPRNETPAPEPSAASSPTLKLPPAGWKPREEPQS